MTLKNIRKLYIALHGGTNASPTAFTTATEDSDSVLDLASSYPKCTIDEHEPPLGIPEMQLDDPAPRWGYRRSSNAWRLVHTRIASYSTARSTFDLLCARFFHVCSAGLYLLRISFSFSIPPLVRSADHFSPHISSPSHNCVGVVCTRWARIGAEPHRIKLAGAPVHAMHARESSLSLLSLISSFFFLNPSLYPAHVPIDTEAVT
jgi:hypothetical protein